MKRTAANRKIWDDAIAKEVNGLDAEGVFEHGLTREDLKARGNIPRMSIVPLKMLLSLQVRPDVSFEKCRGREVATGHKGHMQKGVHFAVVFAAAPAVATSRVLKALSCHANLTPFAYNVSQAYLKATCDKQEQIPVSYPRGMER